jgi:Leucine-rich repeat (LRR) protein
MNSGELFDVKLDCRKLTKSQINEALHKVTELSVARIRLTMDGYFYDTMEDIILPNMIVRLYLNGIIKSLKGLILPNSVEYFNCSDTGLIDFGNPELSDNLLGFDCSGCRIESFKDLLLPNTLVKFNCFDNGIKSFVGLILPNSLRVFHCSHNEITSLTGLELPPNLDNFECFGNKITSTHNFVFPPGLTKLAMGDKVEFINPRFNSVLRDKLYNKVIYDKLDREHLIFVYLNFNLDYKQRNAILNLLEKMK